MNDFTVVLCGEAGQGVQSVEHILTRVLKEAGYSVFATKEYMSRVRGGSNSITLRIAAKPVRAPLDRMDICLPLDRKALEHLAWRMSPETLVLGERAELGQDERIIDVPYSSLAKEIGGAIFANTIAAGVILGLFQVDNTFIESYLRSRFSSKGDAIIQGNLKAVAKGREIVQRNAALQGLCSNCIADIKPQSAIRKHVLLNGADAIGLGAIAGGCNFVSSYPMTPSTGVLTFLAEHGPEFGIVIEQAEDEIAAINMVLGAWYAGGRGLVTTSGGGFALMEEGVSLAGMIESPVVIHLAQRPGPATGLPTRTEQADLNMALYSGHGEFPRVILAPGNIEQAYDLAQRAFEMADRFQVPVFLLSDQYLVDSYYAVPGLPVPSSLMRHVIQTNQDYKRYRLQGSPVSPRGIPGWGQGLVCVDSDEHDEEGHITEDLGLRKRMVEKRLGKGDLLTTEALAPDLLGPDNFETLVVCWGSTRETVLEACSGLEKIAVLHFQQVYPLHPDTAKILKKAKRLIDVENNATAQFAGIVQLQTGIEIRERIVKYDGLAFSVDGVSKELMTLGVKRA